MRSRLVERLPPAGCRRETSGTTGSVSADIRDGLPDYALNDDPHPHVDFAFGFLMVKPPPVTLSTKSTSAPSR